MKGFNKKLYMFLMVIGLVYRSISCIEGLEEFEPEEGKHTVELKLLEEQQKEINEESHRFTENALIDQMKVVFTEGVNVNLRNEDGTTALHFAVRNGYKEMVKFLVRAGIDIEAKDKKGYTALHYAAGEPNNASVVEFLRSKKKKLVLGDQKEMVLQALRVIGLVGDETIKQAYDELMRSYMDKIDSPKKRISLGMSKEELGRKVEEIRDAYDILSNADFALKNRSEILNSLANDSLSKEKSSEEDID